MTERQGDLAVLRQMEAELIDLRAMSIRDNNLRAVIEHHENLVVIRNVIAEMTTAENSLPIPDDEHLRVLSIE